MDEIPGYRKIKFHLTPMESIIQKGVNLTYAPFRGSNKVIRHFRQVS
jgi:hypothetical protein